MSDLPYQVIRVRAFGAGRADARRSIQSLQEVKALK